MATIKENLVENTEKIAEATNLLNDLGDAVFAANEILYNGTSSGLNADDVQEAVDLLQTTKAPNYTYSTIDITAGSTALEEGKLYFVYE